MRAPPAFEVTLHDAPAWRVVQAVLWALAGGALGAWLATRLDASPAGGVVLPAGLAASALACAIGWGLGRPQQAQLRWSGQRWELLHQGVWAAAAPRVMIDLGDWLLLRVKTRAAPARWIGASQASIGPSGQLLRAALYCAPCVDLGRADEDRAPS